MLTRRLAAIILASSFTVVAPVASLFAQDGVKQDLKHAGTETKDAAKDTSHGVTTGSKKAYHKTASGTKVVTHKTVNGTKSAGKTVSKDTKTAAHKTSNGTRKVLHKTENKPDTQ